METEVQLFLLKPAFAAFVRLLELYQSLFQDGVLQLVAALRTPWEASRNTALEVAAIVISSEAEVEVVVFICRRQQSSICQAAVR